MKLDSIRVLPSIKLILTMILIEIGGFSMIGGKNLTWGNSQTVVVRIGEEGMAQGGLKITFLDVENDSRCPKYVDCFHSGSATIRVSLNYKAENTNAHFTVLGGSFSDKPRDYSDEEIASFELGRKRRFSQWEVILLRLLPYPERSIQTIDNKSDYWAEFLVRSGTIQGDDSRIQSSHQEVIKTADFEGVIFGAEMQSFQWVFSQSLTYWTPNKEDIIQAEQIISTHLSQNRSNIYKKLANYKRQYAGIVINGEKIIYANFFCHTFKKDWIKHEIFVMDGGDCYFRIKVNLEKGECFNLEVNGEA